MAEVGFMGGGCFYMGDANSKLYRDTNGMMGAVARYNINPRFAVKGGIAVAGIAGSTDNLQGALPIENSTFGRTLYDVGMQMECNFNGYGVARWNGSKRIAPYYLLGVGMTYAPAPAERIFAINFPIGVGIKYKIADRVNVGVEWSMRFTSTDKLDVKQSGGVTLSDPLMIKSKGMKNKDSYSFTMLYLSFDIFKQPCDCN